MATPSKPKFGPVVETKPMPEGLEKVDAAAAGGPGAVDQTEGATKVDPKVHAASSQPDVLDKSLTPAPGVNMADAPKSTAVAQPIPTGDPESPKDAIEGDANVVVDSPRAFRLLITAQEGGKPVQRRIQFKKGPQQCSASLLDHQYVKDNGVKAVD